jgi:hypothetical protein
MIERKIIIGLITSTEYCQKIKDYWKPYFIESATAKQLALWIWEYFDKYQKAPGKDIESIFYSKVKKDKIQKAIAEEIEEDILPNLSEQYTNEEFNLQYLLEETEKYFSEQHIKIHNEKVQALLTEGKIEDAKALIAGFKPLDKITIKLDDFILTVNEIREKKSPHLTTLVRPWLKEGQTTILYGTYGSGKSLLSILIAYMLGLHDHKTEDCEIGEWSINRPAGSLYIDGELGEREMEERIQQFQWLGDQSAKHRLRILSVPEYQLATEDNFYLSNRNNQQKIIRWLKEHPTYKLVILDSVSTLFGLEEENSNSEWNNKVNPFLRDLRALNVACLLLHHAGKDNKRGLRGASAMGAMAHNIFRLTTHDSKAIEKGEAWFTLSTEKQRAAGFSFKKFSLRFIRDDDEKETHWEVTNNI